MPRIARANSAAEVKKLEGDMRRSTIKRLQQEKEELQEALMRAQTALEERPTGKKKNAPINWNVLFPENCRNDINKDADTCGSEERARNNSVSEVEESATDESDNDDASSSTIHLQRCESEHDA